jgi:alpha-tubulin suppressor-like RCC1 family protein
VSSLSGVTVIAAGASHSLAIASGGAVWAWGLNSSGQLGNGTTANSNLPVEVSGLSDIIAISAGASHSLALRSDGTVWAWGLNTNGQLGNGTTTSSSTPVQVSGLGNVVAIVCGSYHNFALESNGTLWAWGADSYGALCSGTAAEENSPIEISLSGVIGLAAGDEHSVLLKQDGTVEAGGYDDLIQLGVGSNYSVAYAVDGFNAMPDMPTLTVAISAPANNATLSLGQSQTLTATASESGGTIAGVEYYIDSTLVGTSTNSSNAYALSWTPTTWGNYTFTALSVDATGNTSLHSTPVTIQVPYTGE